MSKSKTESITSYEIDKGLYLVRHTIDHGSSPPKAVETPTNHIVAVDCSGSMSSELPRIRAQLKKKFPTLINEGDTLSIVWFSGRGECGMLLEAEPVSTLKDLSDVNKAVDRWLKPVGLTGFKEPIIEVGKVVERIAKKNKNPFSLFFMSDGCDNQWQRADILKAVEQTAAGLSSATFVEYGYYADRPLLAAMAEKAGGSLIFAEAFDKYEVSFEAAMQKRPMGGKRIEVKISGDVVGGFTWSMSNEAFSVAQGLPINGEITTYAAGAGKISIPEGTNEVYYLAPMKIGDGGESISYLANPAQRAVWSENCASAVYAALSLFAVRMKPEIVFPILKALGDVHFINGFSSCFGKQKYTEFMEATKLAAFEVTKRCVDGYNPKLVPPDDAFTVLDLLRVLSEDDSTRILLDHPAFQYSKISRGRVDADENLTADEALAVEVVRSQMAGEKNAKKLKELQAELDVILNAKCDALKFVADPAPDGYAISSLTYNEKRPNISLLVRKTGKVDLTARPEHKKYKIPANFETHIFRNYAIVRDGLVNVAELPVIISKATHDTLVKHGTEISLGLPGVSSSSQGDTFAALINVKPLPILNRKMATNVSAKNTIELEYALTKARAAQKVYKHYQNELFPGIKEKGAVDLYGADGASWLKDNGFTYNGFAPQMVLAESKDFIVGKELDIKLKGLSSIPSMTEAKEKIAKGKPTGGAAMMAGPIKEVDDWLKKNPQKLHEKWLTGKTSSAIAEARGLIHQAAQIRFSIIVGQRWFDEFASLDENQLTVKIDGADIVGTCVLKEIEIKI